MMCTYSEERLTIIYSEISRLVVPDESERKWRVKAGKGRLATQRNQDAGAFEEALVKGRRGAAEIIGGKGRFILVLVFWPVSGVQTGLHPAGRTFIVFTPVILQVSTASC